MAYIIAVANQKGGVAKTTTVVSLGGALAKSGMEVLLIDLDPQADLTLAMGYNPHETRGSIADVLLNSGNILNITHETDIPGIDIIPSNDEMELAEQFLPIRNKFEYVLKNALTNHLPPHVYDIIILDCPPALGSVTHNAINAAQLLIIPTQPEYFSAHAIRNMMVAVRHIRNSGNPNLVYRILITMRDRRNRIHRSFSEHIQTTFKKGLFGTVIDVDTKLRESSVAGLPITHYTAKTRSAIQYQSLAQELTKDVQESVAQSAA
jgi:chromosome partitioning protein